VKSGQVVFAMCPPVFDRDVLALDVTDVTQASVKSRKKLACQFERCKVEKPDHRRRRLLRLRHNGPRRRAAEQGDEAAPFQLIEFRRVAAIRKARSIPEGGDQVRISIAPPSVVGQARQVGALSTLAECPLCLQYRPN
jgi:hypothetical protein